MKKNKYYEKSKKEFAEDIKQNLYERGYGEVTVNFIEVEKANQKYEAMSVALEGSNVIVNFNLDQAFAAYENSGDYQGVVASAANVIAKGLDSALMNYDTMKDRLSIEVISAETNKDLLSKIPHDCIKDLAVVYKFIQKSNDNVRSILVTNNLIKRMGVTPEQLKADALENAPKIRPALIQGMHEMMGIPEHTEEKMYVATVHDKNFGAGVLAYQDFMDQAAEKIGGDFFILPSSIHEIILVPDNGDKVVDDLRDMLRKANATQVSPEQRLTNNVYHYNSKEHIFELAE